MRRWCYDFKGFLTHIHLTPTPTLTRDWLSLTTHSTIFHFPFTSSTFSSFSQPFFSFSFILLIIFPFILSFKIFTSTLIPSLHHLLTLSSFTPSSLSLLFSLHFFLQNSNSYPSFPSTPSYIIVLHPFFLIPPFFPSFFPSKPSVLPFFLSFNPFSTSPSLTPPLVSLPLPHHNAQPSTESINVYLGHHHHRAEERQEVMSAWLRRTKTREHT